MELESRLSNDVLCRCTNGPPKVLDGLKRMFSTNVSSYTLDPEQHGFELCTSALGIFFFPPAVNTTCYTIWVWLELKRQMANYKLHVDFPLLGRSAPIPPVLCKGQLYNPSGLGPEERWEGGSCVMTLGLNLRQVRSSRDPESLRPKRFCVDWSMWVWLAVRTVKKFFLSMDTTVKVW